MTIVTETAFMDATAQAELVRKKEVAPLELVEAAITRIERLNPELNAVVTPMFDLARESTVGELPDGGAGGSAGRPVSRCSLFIEGYFGGLCRCENDHGIQDPSKFCTPL